MGKRQSIRQTDAQHEVRHRSALTTFSAEHSGPVSLGVDTPPAQVSSHPFGSNGIVPGSGELPYFLQALPRVLLFLQPLGPLCFCFLLRRRHQICPILDGAYSDDTPQRTERTFTEPR